MYLGVDIIDSERFEGVEDDRISRIFTPREIQYVRAKNLAAETVAGMFSAKEAFFKAVGTGIIPSQILDLEILHDQFGAPYYRFTSNIISSYRFLSTAKVRLSISTTKHSAIAVCLIMLPHLI
jgi:holo-[acyl-carrier protein] synthase